MRECAKIYSVALFLGKRKSKNSENSAEPDEDPFGDFLSIARDEANIEDRTLPLENAESRLDEDAWERLRNRFVTGIWDSTEDAQALLEADGTLTTSDSFKKLHSNTF